MSVGERRNGRKAIGSVVIDKMSVDQELLDKLFIDQKVWTRCPGCLYVGVQLRIIKCDLSHLVCSIQHVNYLRKIKTKNLVECNSRGKQISYHNYTVLYTHKMR